MSETPPSNDAPQANSTTAIGNGVEGLWVRPAGDMSGLAFIDAASHYVGFASTYLLFDGGVTLAGTNWSFTSGTTLANTSGGIPVVAGVSGSGSVSPRSQFQGTYGSTGTLSYEYSSANALAASQPDVTGTWSAPGASVQVDATGAFTGGISGGSFGDCTLAGTVTHASPGTKKNMYAVSFMASNGPSGTCNLDTAHSYDGYAAITFANTGTTGTPFYVRSLTVMVRTPFSTWVAALLVKS